MDPGRHPGEVRHPMLKVGIDSHSGFCGGVIRAISTAEKHLASGCGRLYSLGEIVHNEEELSRLASMGLVSVGRDGMDAVATEGAPLLIRAHGEPPEVYADARSRGIELIDCTCPVVLKLQKDIRTAYSRLEGKGRLVIFGKIGHPEVLGLVGQVGGDAVVVETPEQMDAFIASGTLPEGGRVELFSQTTMSPSAYADAAARLRRSGAEANVHETICAQVASRHRLLSEFASAHSVLVFVSGRSSSNGKVLFELCRSVNPRCHHVCGPEELDPSWFEDGDNVGVCGATSTPRWLLEKVASAIENLQ